MYEDIERYKGMPEIYAAKKARKEREENWKRLKRLLYGEEKKKEPTGILDVLAAFLDVPTDSTKGRK